MGENPEINGCRALDWQESSPRIQGGPHTPPTGARLTTTPSCLTTDARDCSQAAPGPVGWGGPVTGCRPPPVRCCQGMLGWAAAARPKPCLPSAGAQTTHLMPACPCSCAAAYEGLQAPAAGPTAGREWLSQPRQHHAVERRGLWARRHCLGRR